MHLWLSYLELGDMSGLCNTYYLRLEDVEQPREVVVLAWYLAQVNHFKISAHTWSLALTRIHPPPFLLDLHKYGHLAKFRRKSKRGIN